MVMGEFPAFEEGDTNAMAVAQIEHLILRLRQGLTEVLLNCHSLDPLSLDRRHDGRDN